MPNEGRLKCIQRLSRTCSNFFRTAAPRYVKSADSLRSEILLSVHMPIYAAGMLDLSTLAGLHAHQHELHAFCPRCERWSLIDLARMNQAGKGDRRLPITVRRRACGEAGSFKSARPSGASGCRD